MPRYDLAIVKSTAAGRWREIATQVAGIDDRHLSVSHGPCPRCGGKDRWRVFGDFDATGGGVCNQCGKFGDGIELVKWATGGTFSQALSAVGKHLSVESAETAREGKSGGKKSKAGKKSKPKEESAKAVGEGGSQGDEWNPLDSVEVLNWNPLLAQFWAAQKGLSLSAVLRANGCLVRHKVHICIGFPIRSPFGDEIIGWSLYEAGGGKLPVFAKGQSTPAGWTKVKIIKRRDK